MVAPGDILGIGAFLGGAVDEFWYSDEEKAANQLATQQANASQANSAAQVEMARIAADSRKQLGMTFLLVAGAVGVGVFAYGLLKDA